MLSALDDVISGVHPNLHENFEQRTRQLVLFDCGEKYYPPNEEFKEILRHALESLVGPISETGDAIIWLFLQGDNEIKLRATEWLGESNIRKAGPLLREALGNTSDEPLKLALRYALSCFGEEDLDTFCQDLAKYATGSSNDTVKDQCGNYLGLLSGRVSSDVLGESFYLLATDGDENNRRCAIGLLPEIISRDLGDYSDEVLDSMIEVIKALDICGDEGLDELFEATCQFFEDMIEEERARSGK